ncbi:MAG: hypothetical protein ACOCRK_10265, partial [bacterium]
MNSIEKAIYDLVKSQPKLKFWLRNTYQSLFDLIPDKSNFSIDPIYEREGYFFGFHDISPFSVDNNFLLANKLEIPLKMPNKSDRLTIGYFQGNNYHEFVPLDYTFAWNYHKGCRLQWCGLNSNSIIYNFYSNGLKSKILNIHNKNYRIINYPIDSVSPNGLYATSFSYERLNHLMPGYGYIYTDESYLDKEIPHETGMYIVDLNSNQKQILISIRDLTNIQPDNSMKNAIHFVTHSQFSPDNSYISFLHRWVNKDDFTKRKTRLIIMDRNSKKIYVSPTSGLVSHYAWDSSNGIIAYCNINNIDSHVYFTGPKMEKHFKVVYPELNEDGHQHFIANTNSFVTDTYPA